MNQNYLLLAVVGLIIIVFLLFNKSTLELFGDYDFAKYTTYVDTIYEANLKSIYNSKFPNLVCNILPIASEKDCKGVDGKLFVRTLFPVHIIKKYDASYLAVFNDGNMYKKDSLNDQFWNGPLVNSFPTSSVPLRMISMTSNGLLLGVGFDNNLYQKLELVINDKKANPYETAWQRVPACSDIIYIMYLSDPESTPTDTSKDLLVGINTNGMIVKKNYNNRVSEPFTVLTNDPLQVIKIYFDKNGYMLGISKDFKLYKKLTTDWNTSIFDQVAGGNPTPLNDILYDNDGKLLGLVILPTIGILELQKQQQVYYLSGFFPKELISLTNDYSSINKIIMNDVDIIKAKTGANLANLIGVADPLLTDVSIDVIDNLIKFESEAKLRDFCANKGYVNQVKYQNYELLNQISDQENKLLQLNTVLNDLVKLDPVRSQLQELQIS
jgi:hypothetical protein